MTCKLPSVCCANQSSASHYNSRILEIKGNIVIADRQTCFQLKASFSPCAILQMTHYDLETFEKQLNESIQRAPNFFIGSPVAIDCEKIKNLADIDFVKLKQ